MTKELWKGGASVKIDWFGNGGNGMCMYRLPDPTDLFGGPNRESMPPPLLPLRTKLTDVFEYPSLKALGWPGHFQGALFEAGKAEQAINLNTESFTAGAISGALRGLLARKDIDLVTYINFVNRMETWKTKTQEMQCQDKFSKFRQEMKWSSAHLADPRLCVIDRCSVDDRITEPTACASTEGCDSVCTYCTARRLRTQEQGLCYTSNKQDIDKCEEIGGLVIEDYIFEEISGVSLWSKVCALPHRPLMYCQSPGFHIKRCAKFDEEHCERDPLGALMGCTLQVQTCKTRQDCELSGSCSDVDIGLSNAVRGTCVVTPLDDDLIQRGCSKEGLCFFKLDPAFGMEVRQRHGLLDLSELNLEQTGGTDLEDAYAFATRIAEGELASEDIDTVRQRLQSQGRFTKQECESLDLGEPFKAVYIERSKTPQKCEAWKSCCLLTRGDRCELFSGQVVHEVRDPILAKARREECSKCDGTWQPVFRWTPGEWGIGTMKSPEREWYPRSFSPINKWVQAIDINFMRQIFENALETRIAKQRYNAAASFVEPLMTSLKVVASACGSESHALDSEVERQAAGEKVKVPSPINQMPKPLIELGSVLATSGLISSATIGDVSLSWHEFSADKYGLDDLEAVTYSVAMEPWEYLMGSAATQAVLPGRTNIVREKLKAFLTEEETTTTLSPANMETLRVSELEEGEGHPAWLVNEMMMMGVDTAAQEESERQKLAATAEVLRQERIRAAQEKARQADLSSGLPEASIKVVLGEKVPFNRNETVNITNGTDPSSTGTELNITSAECRSVVPNSAGEVIGQIIGDCVHLKSSQQLVNSVELCMPLSFGGEEAIRQFNSTPQAQSLGFVLDFANKTQVPDDYRVIMPEALPAGMAVPGQIGSVMWILEESYIYGRKVPGTAMLQSLGMEAVLRAGSGGPRLCAKVYHADTTYCPIIRLKTDFYRRLWKNSSGIPEIFSLETNCKKMDSILSEIHNIQASKSTNPDQEGYYPMDQQISSVEEMNLRSQEGKKPLALKPSYALDVCFPGNCLVRRGRGFEVVSKANAGDQCVVNC
eukprot:TRINITY_DN19806_c0_g1_i1.p1 TRINITY_DN19806_c0_g1~~TRINITY_DN19806_c0_g1_i1.p1  ORF type:complete len:1096 (-),score=191.91 TRINITY_DN19806_c0_g1_i1:309-3479(-)